MLDYLGLIELMGIFTLPQHLDPLNLIHNVNYILHELLPCTCLWCLPLGFVYACGDCMVSPSFTGLRMFYSCKRHFHS